MPPSQLKRLKASLREQGITGPQKSKKQKKSQNKNADHRAQQAAALTNIRESFNPFEFKALARPKKFEYTTNRPQDAKKTVGRPGVTKSMGEETRRKTLLPEMNRRNKVGGILDRRIGEGDPSMSLDDKMMARFEREQQRKKGVNVFDLEEAEDEVELTHAGAPIGVEDYDAASIIDSSDDEESGFLKRKRTTDGDEEEEDNDGPEPEDAEQPERKKTKAEVMKEVMAKSKLHKHERQQLKEDDDDLRDELDKELPDILAALRGHFNKPAAVPEPPKEPEAPKMDFGINPDRAALLAGLDREVADKEYDKRMRQMMFDQRSKPTERTKTEEEKALQEAKLLKELEEKRLRRMKGEPESDEEEEEELVAKDDDEQMEDEMESEQDDADEFGLSKKAPGQWTRPEGIDDEDDFLLDDDLIASDSEADISEESENESVPDETMAAEEEADDEFLKDVVTQSKNPAKGVNGVALGSAPSKLAYTYPCPRTHEELLEVFKDIPTATIPTVVQRIRALYHAGLHEENKEKLADFACALVDHISYVSNQTPPAPLTITETLIRHIHSLSRSYPVQIATRFRHQLSQLQASNNPTPGDLTILTAIGTIYPTSDHFHQVVTPATTLIARWLGLTSPMSTKDVATGAYIGALCVQYQKLSKRYIPEIIRYSILCLNSPHITPSLVSTHTKNILSLADLWNGTPAFTEIFTPLLAPLTTRKQTAALQHLKSLLSTARLTRRPQELHHHRPLPIKTSVPKFEEGFDPNKHYDPDKERAESNKLHKEYKRERKGALRELRKDSNFIAREKLKEKKERDRKYEEKYKRLVAEIQGEEGREKNEYEREKRKRKAGR